MLVAVRAEPVSFGGLRITIADVAALGALAAILLALARGKADAGSLASGGGTGIVLLVLPGLLIFVLAVVAARLLAPALRLLERAGRTAPVSRAHRAAVARTRAGPGDPLRRLLRRRRQRRRLRDRLPRDAADGDARAGALQPFRPTSCSRRTCSGSCRFSRPRRRRSTRGSGARRRSCATPATSPGTAAATSRCSRCRPTRSRRSRAGAATSRPSRARRSRGGCVRPARPRCEG